MICSYCEIKQVEMKRRPLCKTCYRELHKAKMLDEFPLMPADELFRASLTEKYGKEILADFDALLNQNEMSMSDISKKYGFTRERARQLFEKIFKFHFTVIKNQRKARRLEKAERDRQLKKNPCEKVLRFKEGDNSLYKGAVAEKKVFDICVSLGYEIKPFTDGQAIDLIINDYKIDVKSAYTTTLTGGGVTRQFHFGISDYQRDNADFIICYAEPINKYFIIPISEYPPAEHLYIPEKSEHEWVWHGDRKMHSKSKWYSYLEAWHLLAPEPKEIVFNSLLSASAVNIVSPSMPVERRLSCDRETQAVQ